MHTFKIQNLNSFKLKQYELQSIKVKGDLHGSRHQFDKQILCKNVICYKSLIQLFTFAYSLKFQA